MSFNKVILTGHLTRDPELRYTPKGTAVCNLSLAVNRTWMNEAGEKKEDVTFVDCTAWGRVGENIAQYLTKGRPLLIEGRLHHETWDDKTTGQKRSRLKVIVETFQFMDSNKGDGEKRTPASRPTPLAQANPPLAGDGPPESDDVPF